MANLIEIILLAVDEASGTISRVARETSIMEEHSLTMGAAMLTGGLAATALAVGLAKIAETGAEFQQFTQEIANNTTMTDGQLGQMRTTILAMSEDGGVAYEKLGTAFMKVMNITNDAAASQGILQVAMESAVATGGNVVSVANVLANAMHEYGLDVVRAADGTIDLAAVQENAAHVMGVMHLAAAEGNMTLEQFSEASGRAIGIAANLGVPLEDVSAGFAALTKHGFDAATAGTQMVNIMTHMINPTQAAAKEIKRISDLTGIDLVSDFSAAGLHSKGLEGVLGDLKEAYSRLGLTEAQGEQESMKLINAQRGGLGLATLLGTAWTDYNNILKDLNNTQAVNAITEDQYNKIRDQAVNQWQRLQQTVRATAITIGIEMLPAASALLGHLLALATGVLHWAQAHATLIGPLLATVAGVLAVVGVLMTLGGLVMVASSTIGALVEILAGPLLAALVVGAVAWKIWHDHAAEIRPLLGPIIDGARNLVGAIGEFGLRSPQAAAAFGLLVTALKNFVTGVAPLVASEIGKLADAFGTWIHDRAIPYLQQHLPQWRDALVGWLTGTAIPAARLAAEHLADALGTWIEGTAIPYLRTHLPQWSSALEGWLTGTAIPAVKARASEIGTAIGAWIEGTAIPYLRANLPRWGSEITTFLTGAALALKIKAGDLASALGSWISDTAIPFLRANLPRWRDELVNWITGTAVPAVKDAARKLGEAIVQWVQESEPRLHDKLDSWGATILAWIDTARPEIKAKSDSLSDALTDWIQQKAIPTTDRDMPKWVEAITKALDQGDTTILAKTEHMAESLGNWIGEKAVPLAAAGMHHFSTEILVALVDMPAAIGLAGIGLAKALTDWITDPGQSLLVQKLERFLTAILEWIAVSTLILFVAALALGKGLAEGLAKGIEAAWPGTLGKLHDGLTKLETAASDAMTRLREIIEHGFNNITVSTAAFPGTLLGAMGSLAALLIPKGAELILGFVTGITSMTGTAMDIVAALPEIVAAGVGSTIGLLFQRGADLVQGFINGIESRIGAARDAAAQLAGLTTDSVGNILQTHSPSKVTERLGEFFGQGFVLGIRSQYAVAQDTASGLGGAVLTGLLDGIDADNADAAKKIADATSAVAKAITDALAAATALSNFDPDTAPSFGVVHAFAVMVGMIVQELQNVASFFEEKGLKAAGDFADAAGKVLGLFKYALDLTKGLADFAPPTFALVHAFALAVGMIVQEFQWVASFFKDTGLKAAADFADSAGKVLDLVGKAVAAITALGAGPIKDVPFQAVHQLALTVGMIVQELQWVATFFAEKGLAQTALFADAAGKVLDTVTKAVAAVTALPDLADPGWEAVHRFAVVVGTIVQEIAWVATFFKDQALKSAADFSDSATKVMGLFNEGIVGGLMKLADFVAPSKLAIDNFLAVVFYVVSKFTEAASRLSTEGIKATTDFSNAAQAALTATKTGVDAFKDLTKLVVPSKEAIDNLLNAVRYVVDRMLDMANQMTNVGIQRVTAFGTASSTVAKGITDVLDLFKKLGETPYKDMLSKGLAAVLADFNVALTAIQALATQSQTFLNSALKFKDNMEAAAAAIAAAAAAASAAQGTHIPALPSAPSAPSLPGGSHLPPPKIGHADGGWVVPGQEYRVGERGGETFVSAVPGYIVPHGAGGGGGGDTLQANFTFNLDGQKVTDVVYTRLLRMRRNKPSLGLS